MELKFQIYEFLMKNGKKWLVQDLSGELKMTPRRLLNFLNKLTIDYKNIKVRAGVRGDEYYWEEEK